MVKLLPEFFTKSKRDRVTTIEVSDYKNHLIMPEWRGNYTIRNVNPPTSDDLFIIDEGNVIEGYIEAQNAKTLNLINDKKKMILTICNSYYHSVMDDMSELFYALALHPEGHEIILDISDIAYYFKEEEYSKFYDIMHSMFRLFEEKKIAYRLVELKNYDIIYINDFKIIRFIYESGQKANLVYDFFKPLINDQNIKPFRKVFVSRSMAIGRVFDPEKTSGLSYYNDQRIQDTLRLDEYFKSLGFEVVFAEDFDSFEDQINYFNEVDVLVGITGSGLTNAVWMQPGTTMVEIVTPLLVSVAPPDADKDVTNPFVVQELHNFYKNIAFYKDQTFIAFQNETRNNSLLEATIEKNKKIIEVLINE